MDNILILLSFSNTFFPFLGALLGAIIPAAISYFNNKKQLLNDLDNKSGWRAKMYEMASKPNIRMNDIYMLRTSVRVVKKKRLTSSTFDWVTNDIIDFCNFLENKYYYRDLNYDQSKLLSFEETQLFHLFSRYLLKHHWEVNQMKSFRFIKKLEWHDENRDLYYEIKKDENYQIIMKDIKKYNS